MPDLTGGRDESVQPSFRSPPPLPPPLSAEAAAVVPELMEWFEQVAGQVGPEQPQISFWAGVFMARLHIAAAEHRGVP